MKRFLKVIFRYLLIFLQKPLNWLLFRDAEKLKIYEAKVKNKYLSGMVSEFNALQRFLFFPFFRKVQYISSDITTLKTLVSPIVYVIKNRGELEYEYFNYLFIKENIAPVWYAKGSLTVHWLPLKTLWAFLIWHLNQFYKRLNNKEAQNTDLLKENLLKGKNVLLNIPISRDYLFGLVKKDLKKDLDDLVAIQKQTDKPIKVVSMQFLYDKHPDKTELSYFDLLFGEKSQPGLIRKFILFLLNYRRKPRVKFGLPIDLKDFVSECHDQACVSEKLLQHIEEDWRVEKARVTGPKLLSKDALIQEIMMQPVFQTQIGEIAQQNNQNSQDALKEIRGYLKEIAADVNYSFVHFGHITLKHVWTKIFDGVVVKHDQLTKVRDVAGKNPIVLVPMHRSHIDYLLISDIFYEHNITFPHICSGINLNFWPAGALIRKGGGFFIRRRFKGNKLYREALNAYIKTLVKHGYCLEFFIEGTRSRTGRQLEPKMGILGMIMQAFFDGAADDIHFVPIAVNYDHILEEKAYQSEGVGKDKNKENAQELLKVRKIFKKKYGKVYIEFDDPISLSDYCRKNQIELLEAADHKKDVATFAYHITQRIMQAAVVNPISLVSLAALSMNKQAFTYESLTSRIKTFKDFLDFNNAVYSDLLSFNESYAYHQAIKKLCERGLLKQMSSFDDDYYVFEDKHRADFDYYRNNIIHFYVMFSCFCKSLMKNEAPVISVDEILQKIMLLKKLFKYDLVFFNEDVNFKDLDLVIQYAVAKEYVSFDKEKRQIVSQPGRKQFEEMSIFSALLDNLLESHLMVLHYLKHNKVLGVDKKTLIKEIIQKAKPMFLSQTLTHPEALSRFNLENSFKVMVDLGLLTKNIDDHSKTTFNSIDDAQLYFEWIKAISELIESQIFVNQKPLDTLPKEKTGKTNTTQKEIH